MLRAVLAVAAASIVSAAGLATLASSQPSSQAGFTPAKHRKPPDLANHGQVPKALRIIAFVPKGYPHQVELRDWPQAIAHSQWLARLEQAYGVPTSPAPIVGGYIVSDMPALPHHDVTTRSVFDKWVAGKLAAHGIPAKPLYQTIVILFDRCSRPQSLDGFGCVSHHPWTGNGIDSYALSLGNPTGSEEAQRDSLTATASHEVAEAVTNTLNGWRLTAVDKDHPWVPSLSNTADPQHGLLATPTASPFLEDEGSGNIEAADLTAGARWFEPFTPPGFANPVTYEYVRVFSRFGNDHRNDPAVPPAPAPYYNVSTASDWYYLKLGDSKTITVTGWSTKRIPRWHVTASIPAWEGSSARGGARTQPSPCSLASGSSADVANRDTFALKVLSTRDAVGSSWCVVHFVSTPTTPDATGDASHSWYVGFILELP